MMFHIEEEWRYELFPLDSDAELFPGFEAVLTEWRAACRGNEFPRWADITPRGFDGWWSWAYAVDILQTSPFEGRVIYCGSHMARAMGVDATYKSVTAADAVPYWESNYLCPADVAFYEALATEPRIGRTTGPVHLTNEHFGTYQDVVLPLATKSKPLGRLLFLGTATRQ
jgi:hypothetical protein